ncbi:MAG: hypothetical protein AB8G26_02725 [Ilumatobacter sp.]
MSTDTTPARDLRAGLSVPDRTPINKPAQYFEFAKTDPTDTSEAGSPTWWVRSQSMVVAYTEAVAGDTFTRTGQGDEYAAVTWGDGVDVSCAWGDQTERAVDKSFIALPPGDSSITFNTDGVLIRLFTTRSDDLNARCDNDAAFELPDPFVAPFEAWPDPVGGFKVRVYRLDDYPPDSARMGRLFRTTTFMVNAFYDFDKPRPEHRMSPHHHDDFEQVSLTLAGDFMHHIRHPWTTDLAEWRDDEHRHCTSPSVTVIPPPTVHGSQWFSDHNQLLDVFAPPRHDFSSKDGWVINANDYPMPS